MSRPRMRKLVPASIAALAAAGLAALAGLAAPGAASTRATPPTNTTPPSISGAAVEGSTLTASSGTWSGDPQPTFTYRWKRCDQDGASCDDIATAVDQTYVVASSDVGHRLRVEVTAGNDGGTAAALSDPTSVVVATATMPSNSSPPVVTGSAQEGQTLSTSDGSWTGTPTPTFTYAWERCNSSGSSCATIGGQTGKTYALTARDVGSTVRSAVTANNAAGSATARSNPTAAVAAAGSAPRATSQPNVTGTLKVGQTLTVGTGTWSGPAPVSFSFAWQRCSTAGQCSTISGATRQTYVATTSDVGYRLRAVVTAHNPFGTGSVTSNLSAGPIATNGAKPAASAAPTLSGEARQGSRLTTTVGSWSSASSVRFAYAWLRCDGAGNACAAIPGATGSSYTLAAADVGHRIRSQITVTNATGATSASSNPTTVVTATPSGVTRLANGTNSISVTAVALPQRLVISGVAFTPSQLGSLTSFSARFRVTDSRGYAVRDALVYAIALPYGLVYPAAEARTDSAGYATITFRPTARLPRRGALVMFVRARKPGDSLLAGVSTRRLVQVLVRR
jgi:hypothetical protein